MGEKLILCYSSVSSLFDGVAEVTVREELPELGNLVLPVNLRE